MGESEADMAVGELVEQPVTVQRGTIMDLRHSFDVLSSAGLRVSVRSTTLDDRVRVACEALAWLLEVAQTGDRLMHVVALSLAGVPLNPDTPIPGDDPILPLRLMWTYLPPVPGSCRRLLICLVIGVPTMRNLLFLSLSIIAPRPVPSDDAGKRPLPVVHPLSTLLVFDSCLPEQFACALHDVYLSVMRDPLFRQLFSIAMLAGTHTRRRRHPCVSVARTHR
jgi:hypothetical protein